MYVFSINVLNDAVCRDACEVAFYPAHISIQIEHESDLTAFVKHRCDRSTVVEM